MGARLGGDDDEGIVDINVTPFVDIALVLLVIFMVTTSYIVRRAIRVDLPEAATGEHQEDVSVGIVVQRDGSVLLDGEPVDRDGLRRALRERLAALRAEGRPDRALVALISADRAVAHGEVVGVIDLLRQEGIARFALDVRPVPAEAAAAAGGGGE